MELDAVCIPLGVEIKVLSSIKSFKNPVKTQSDTIILQVHVFKSTVNAMFFLPNHFVLIQKTKYYQHLLPQVTIQSNFEYTVLVIFWIFLNL